MKSSDLRIGNFIYYKVEDELDDRKSWNELNIVDAEDILSIEAAEINKWDHGYSPIPLTERHLIKFGFNKKEEEYIKDKFPVKFDIDWNCYIDRDFENELFINIEYVHQLQNLYFALTGEELKRKTTNK